MAKVITDNKKIEEILNRSIAEILPSKQAFREALLSGKQLKVYIGADATGPALHLGHATNYMVLERLRQLGHKVVILIGDFTARIGDPTDKLAVRQQLTREDVKRNVKTWLKQLQPIVDLKDKDNPVEIVYNHSWLSKLNFENIINLASNFTVQQMLERDMFEKRMVEGRPIYLHEFFYPLMQGYDSVELDVDAEMCGTDQKFNALVGRSLMKKLKNKEKFVIITTLLENPVTGEKMMSKSLGTGVFLNESAENMYGKLMAQPDENLPQLFIDCTYVYTEEIEKIKKDLKSNAVNPRDIKMRLAYEITKIYHGEIKAQAAQESFVNTFQKKEIPNELEVYEVNKVGSINIIDLLSESGLVNSKSEARRLIDEKAIKVDGEVISDTNKEIKITEKGFVLQRGKKQFKKIIKV
ncbi:MAG: Tyrosine--tRNA ligase [Parcubacteria group bacterium ADurb.Bin316]|nr:MAG: Tyrosine--tRNA ligase [Parcubacteria group bacterium ADurb.Bin316]HOZ55997.1 tyrosine--tRNA ligase [bacterium]